MNHVHKAIRMSTKIANRTNCEYESMRLRGQYQLLEKIKPLVGLLHGQWDVEYALQDGG